VKNPYRIGETIYLRAQERSDAARITPWLNDPAITRNLSMYRPMSELEEESRIVEIGASKDDVVCAIVERASDELIGVTGLHGVNDKNRRAMLGIVIGEQSHWGKGYGTEATRLMVALAFDTLNLNRVWLDVFTDNPRAVRCYEKVGFKHEGVMRQQAFREGAYHDVHLMALLRDEWRR
jgi:diamine N-acetyltransferase